MMQRKFAAALALALVGTVVAAPIALAATRAAVAPSIGTRKTAFVVRFRASSATAGSTNLHRRYEAFVSGAHGRRCTTHASAGTGVTDKSGLLSVTLRPTGRRHVWCAGRFRGRVVEFATITCRPLAQIVCPAIEIMPVTIARFGFRVMRRASEMKAIADTRPLRG